MTYIPPEAIAESDARSPGVRGGEDILFLRRLGFRLLDKSA